MLAPPSTTASSLTDRRYSLSSFPDQKHQSSHQAVQENDNNSWQKTAHLLKGIGVEAELHEVLEVEAKGLDIEVEEEDGVVEQEDDQHQHNPASKTYFGESSDSIIDTFAQETISKNISLAYL